MILRERERERESVFSLALSYKSKHLMEINTIIFFPEFIVCLVLQITFCIVAKVKNTIYKLRVCGHLCVCLVYARTMTNIPNTVCLCFHAGSKHDSGGYVQAPQHPLSLSLSLFQNVYIGGGYKT
jgi:hypothetical protein